MIGKMFDHSEITSQRVKKGMHAISKAKNHKLETPTTQKACSAHDRSANSTGVSL
jgi:hypothetical protein